MYTVRRAENADIPTIMKLLVQVDMVHHNGRPDIFRGPVTKYLEEELAEMFTNDTLPVYVCVEDGQVLGHAFCQIKELKGHKVLQDCKTFYVDDICVDEAARGKGVGRALYGHVKAEDCRKTWAAYRRDGGGAAMKRLEEERNALLRRMGDLSIYMKELKQWISRDYNKKVGRKGTLWEDRFWSCLLEDSATVLTQVAYYIDCNAVRAGIVDRPEDYKWCGYAQAHAGQEAAQKALSAIFRDSPEIAWAEAEERYGWLLRAVSDTPARQNPEHDEIFWRALAIGRRGFILETSARFPKVFSARKRPSKPFVTDIGETDDVIYASHKPRRIGVG